MSQEIIHVHKLKYHIYSNKFIEYRNDHIFSDRQVWTNSVDPDQNAPTGADWSGSTLFAIPSTNFGCFLYGKSLFFKF